VYGREVAGALDERAVSPIALEAGLDEVLADVLSQQVKQGLSAPRRSVYLRDLT
jgi:hypothetical protein